MRSVFLFIIFILIFTSASYASINTLTGWDGMNISVMNDNLRAISSKTGIQQINTINDLSNGTSLSVINENLALVGRQLSIPSLNAITGYEPGVLFNVGKNYHFRVLN